MVKKEDKGAGWEEQSWALVRLVRFRRLEVRHPPGLSIPSRSLSLVQPSHAAAATGCGLRDAVRCGAMRGGERI